MTQDGTKLVRSGKLIRLADMWDRVAEDIERMNTATSQTMADTYRRVASQLRTTVGIENPGN